MYCSNRSKNAMIGNNYLLDETITACVICMGGQYYFFNKTGFCKNPAFTNMHETIDCMYVE